MTIDALAMLAPGAIEAERRRVVAQLVEAAREGRVAVVGSAALPQKCVAAIEAEGGTVDCYIEWDPRFWAGEVAGKPVLSPDAAFARLGADALIVVGVWSPNHRYAQSEAWLKSFGFCNVLPVASVFWAHGERLGEHYQLSGPSLFGERRQSAARLRAALDDAESRRQLDQHLTWRVTLDAASIPLADKARVYFDPQLFRLPQDGVVVDVGAFDGDSLRSFLYWHGSRFGRFFAIEPDPISFGRLTDYVGRLPAELASRIQPVNAAAGDQGGVLKVTPTGALGSGGVQPENQGVDVPLIRLADRFAGDRVDYLKFDIEGSEWAALDGAWPLFDDNRMILGLAVYHRPADIIDLPLLLIDRLGRETYRYYLRSHDEDGIDLVFYAVPEERAVLKETPRP